MELSSSNKIAQDKLKLLYILNYINLPLTNAEITNFILDNDFLDYFTLQQSLGDLCDSKFVVLNLKNGNKYYSISEAGIVALDMFSEKLPKYFIKHRELLGHYYKKKDDEYIVSLQVMENESTIFSLSINVPDEELAKHICKKWDSSPETIFSSILKTLTTDFN